MTMTLDHTQALEALRELQTAGDVLPAVEAARRARAILDRHSLPTFTVEDFLIEKGLKGFDLFRASMPVGRLAAAAHRERYGAEPMRVWRSVEHRGQVTEHRVCEYLGEDRPLVEAAYQAWLAGGAA